MGDRGVKGEGEGGGEWTGTSWSSCNSGSLGIVMYLLRGFVHLTKPKSQGYFSTGIDWYRQRQYIGMSGDGGGGSAVHNKMASLSSYTAT